MAVDVEGKEIPINELIKEGVGIEPIGPRFIAVRAKFENKSQGGIHLPIPHQEREERLQPEVVIIKVSKDLKDERFKPGVRVLLNHQAMQQEFTFAGRDYVIVDLATVKGIYEQKEEIGEQRKDDDGQGEEQASE